MKKIFLILVLVCPIILVAQNEAGQVIQVVGIAVDYIEAEEITLYIKIEERENLKNEITLQEKEKELRKLVKSYEIPDGNLWIDYFDAHRSSYYSSTKNKVNISKTYKLKVSDLNRIDELIISILEIGADDIGVASMKSSAFQEMKKHTTQAALDNASEKAQLMAAHMGVKLGKVVQITEETENTSQTQWSNNNLNKVANNGWKWENQTIEDDNSKLGMRKITIVQRIGVQFAIE